MYLSQVVLNPKSRQARKDLADRNDLHRTIMNAFPETLPADDRVLFRLEEATIEPVVIVQSQYSPNWNNIPRLQNDYLTDDVRVREVTPQIPASRILRFRLQANPTVKRDGKRHALLAEDDLWTWLTRKGQQHGFTVDAARVHIKKLGDVYGNGRNRKWHAVQYDGILTVVDEEQFIVALQSGIGSAKAFGFGLLSIPYTSS